MTSPANLAVIWDVDGTLVDTAELHFAAWQKLAAEIGKTYTREDFAGTFGWRNPEIIPHVWGKHLTLTEIHELGDRKEAYYRAEAEKGLDLLPGVAALVAGLREAGVPQAIGSSAPRGNVELILDMTGLRSAITESVAMEDVTRGKPEPDVFLKAAAKLGVSPTRCVVFEDAPVGVRAAKSGGMKAIGVTFVGHHPREKLVDEGADLVVPCLSDVSVTTVRELFMRG